jgi:hypothetical protein
LTIYFKKSGAENPVDQIQGNEKIFLDVKNILSVFKKTQSRDLLAIKSDAEFAKVRKLFTKTEYCE